MTRRELFFVPFTAAALQARKAELPFRQIHLDFHTSELIPDVGADFNAAEFAQTLDQARVNSINVFAKCHHGYAYYETKLATMHPALKVDMLGEMVKALKPRGIEVNYYYSLVWDVNQARKHPEWRCRDAKGTPVEQNQWPWLCMNSPYLDVVLAENREVVEKYDCDGAWFDILKQPEEGCYCRWCVEERKQKGITDVYRHNKMVALRCEQKLFDLVKAKRPAAATFYNSRLVIGVRDELPYYSHIEIESLPTGGWGYSHFQQRVRYMRTLGKDFVGMTGRFHKSWGDFGGLKNQAALDYECLNFLANGAKVCVGDQLHPRGRLDAVTYRRIGATYRKIEALEPWAKGARAVADIGVISSASTNKSMTTTKIPPVDQGAVNLLLELHRQFEILDLESRFADYKVLVVPDDIAAAPGLAAKLDAYVEQGGSVIVSSAEVAEAWPAAGVKVKGPAKFQGSYLLLDDKFFPSLDTVPYYLYQQGVQVEAAAGTQVLARYGAPYFDRSAAQFSSHKQTPFAGATSDPLITQKGRVVFVANPFFRSYSQDAYGIQRDVVGVLLDRLLPQPSLRVEGLPTTAQATLLRQGERRIVHLLYYPLTRRAPDIDIIEEPGIAENVTLELPGAVKRAYLAPSRQALEVQGNRVRVPRFQGHAAVVVE